MEGPQNHVVVGQVLPPAFQHCPIRRQHKHDATPPGDLNHPARQAGQAELRLKVPVAKLLHLVQRVGLDEDRAQVEVALLRHDALLQKKPLLPLLSLALGHLLGQQPVVSTAALGAMTVSRRLFTPLIAWRMSCWPSRSFSVLSCVSLATLRSSMPWSRFCSSWASLSRQSSSSSSVSSLPTRPPDAVQRPVWSFRVRIFDHSGV